VAEAVVTESDAPEAVPAPVPAPVKERRPRNDRSEPRAEPRNDQRNDQRGRRGRDSDLGIGDDAPAFIRLSFDERRSS